MTRQRKEPLRALTSDERGWLERMSRSQAEPAGQVARAKMVLAVADGKTNAEAAQVAGRRSDEAVAQVISRFNQDGIAAVERRHGGGPAVTYGPAERERILREFRRPPDRETDGSATWTLALLQRALRNAPDGLPEVSIDTIWRVLREVNVTWQRDRTWCETGRAIRKRKSGVVTVIDPDAEAKKS